MLIIKATSGFRRNVLGFTESVILIDGVWRTDTGEVVAASSVFLTEAESVRGQHKKIKKFSKKRHVGRTFTSSSVLED